MKNKIVAILCLLFVLLIKSNANAQFVQDITGKPFNTGKYTDVTGSPFLFDKWVNGTVKLKGGDTYKDVPLKYDVVSNELYFKSKKGDTLTFVEPVTEFRLADDANVLKTVFRNGYTNVGRYAADMFFEVLADGAVQLLKKHDRYVAESKELGSAVTKRTIIDDVKYFVYAAGKATQVKKDKKSILNALPGKEQQLNDFAKANNLNFKTDSDLAALITYYNSQ